MPENEEAKKVQYSVGYVPIGSLTLHPNNPRQISEVQFNHLKRSIKDNPEFFEARPILYNKDRVIFAGNMRWRAAKELGMTEVPAVLMDVPKEKQDEIMMLDNKQNGEMDWDMVANNFDVEQLKKWGFDEKEIDFSKEEPYTKKIEIPIYEPNGRKPELNSLVDVNKTNILISEIVQSNLSAEEKQFLILAAYRHMVFNYSLIADYYANSGDEVKALMEKSALVIIDKDKAIENGFMTYIKAIDEVQKEDYGE